jgi:hypothetical protein
LPAPFGPIKALVEPAPTRKVASSRSGLPSGSVRETLETSM